MLYPLSVFFPVIIKEALFLPNSSRSLCVFVHILSCLPKGVPLQSSTFSHSTFFSCWNIPISIHARLSISCFGKNPPLTPRLLQLVPHFCSSAQQNFLEKLFILAVITSLPCLDSILASFQEAITPLKQL